MPGKNLCNLVGRSVQGPCSVIDETRKAANPRGRRLVENPDRIVYFFAW